MAKRAKIIYWIATGWLALDMISTGIVQLLKSNKGAGGLDSVTHLGYPVYFLTILGVWKMLGVVAILIPKVPILKEWAYAGFFFAMSGAILSHGIAGSGFANTFPAVLSLVLVIASWYLRPPDRKVTAMR